MEVAQALEFQLDAHRAAFFAQLVRHAQDKARLHSEQHLIEVVTVNMHELAVPDRRQIIGGLAREIAHYADDERQFFHHHRPADLDIVGDVDARRANAADLLLYALFFHKWLTLSSSNSKFFLLFVNSGRRLKPQCLSQLRQDRRVFDDVFQPAVEPHISPLDRALNEKGYGTMRFRLPEIAGDLLQTFEGFLPGTNRALRDSRALLYSFAAAIAAIAVVSNSG